MRSRSCLVFAFALAAACGHSPGGVDAGTVAFTPSTTTPNPLQFLELTTDVALARPTLSAQIAGSAAAVYQAGPSTIVVALPDLAAGAATLHVAIDNQPTPDVALTIQALSNVPADPAADFRQRIAAAQASFAQLGSGADVTAAIDASNTNFAAVQSQFDALSATDQALVARYLAANDPTGDSARFQLPAWNQAAANLVFDGARCVAAGAAVALVAGGTVGVIAGGLVLYAIVPHVVDDMLALAQQQGILTDSLQIAAPDGDSSLAPRAAGTIHFQTGVAKDLALAGTFRTLQASDAASSTAAIHQAAETFGDVTSVINADDPSLPSAYDPPAFGGPSSKVVDVPGASITASTGTPDVVVEQASPLANGIRLVLEPHSGSPPVDAFVLDAAAAARPDACTSFTLTLTYSDNVNPMQTVAAPADLDCTQTQVDAGALDAF
jgi:hypothetical protein|nr:hypothetical protein [Kofleriaceae bacterium]